MADSTMAKRPRIDTTTSWLWLEDESVESRLLAAIAQVLDRPKDSIEAIDSFVDLGGDQETAAALRKVCMAAGMAVKTRDILRCSTLAELQTCITPCGRQTESQESFSSVESVMIAPLEIHKASRLSAADAATTSHSRQSSQSSTASSNETMTQVEEMLSAHKLVSRIATARLKAGLLEGKLVAFITLVNIDPPARAGSEIRLVPQTQIFFAGTQVATLRRAAEASQLPGAIPEIWIVLESLPLAESGTIDRRRLRTWAQNMNEETHRRIMSMDIEETLQAPTNEMERSLQNLVGKVLQVPRDQIGVNFTFSQLGGDEMSAMELAARCKHESIYLHTNETLQNATIADLAAAASQRGGLAHRWEDDNPQCFDLSPMQQLYFRTVMGGDRRRRNSADGSYRFNQSLLLRLKKHYTLEDVSAAVAAVVGHHPMLRSRFSLENGAWSQRIVPETNGSYAFNCHSVSRDNDVEMIIENTQSTINIQDGPVFAADYFRTNDSNHMIYIAAHHLVVDLASWRVIIHDLDELLENGSLLSQRSMPFQKWTEIQRSMLRAEAAKLPSLPGLYADYAYWGLRDVPNTYGDAREVSFSLSSELTSILQGACNQVFRTDSVEIYLAALMLSFAQIFPERPMPVVWNQEHGRDTWSSDIDISETVGWFTSLCPVAQRVDSSDDFISVLRRLKDFRRFIPSRGSQFLASRFDNPATPDPNAEGNAEVFSLDNPFEIVFSYAGSLQHLERDNGVLESIAIPGRTLASRTSDIGNGVGRIAVFEVSAMVDRGAAKIKFLYSRYSRHQDRIDSWISNYEHLLLEAIGRLRYHAQELTLADVPHLDATYEGLQQLNENRLKTIGLTNVRDIEAVYPVTATQQRLLIGQTSDPANCLLHTIYEFSSPSGEVVDTSKLCTAWEMVVARHAALRTVFIESVTETGLYDQIVLRKTSPDMLFIDTLPPEDPIAELNNLPVVRVGEKKPPHRLTVCKTPTKMLIKLDISMVVCDIASARILFADLHRAYSTQRLNPEPVTLLYPDYLEHIKASRNTESLVAWRERLQSVQPCILPRLSSRPSGPHTRLVHTFFNLDVPSASLATFAKAQSVSASAVVRLAWSLVLRAFTGSSGTCFGYFTNGRDLTGPRSNAWVGSFANVVPCAVTLSSYASIVATLRTVDEQLSASLAHQYITLPEVQRALGLTGGERLFNTTLSYADDISSNKAGPQQEQQHQLKQVLQRVSTDFDVSAHVFHVDGKVVVDLCQTMMSTEQATTLASTFGSAVQAILTSAATGSVGGVSLFGDRDYAQIVAWSGETDTQGRKEVVQELIGRQPSDAAAICAWDGDLSYGQLNEFANKLAGYLVDAGIGPNAVVPVVLDKSKWSIVALLAVLKTGAAFAPVDSDELGLIQPVFDKLSATVAVVAESAAGIIGNLIEQVIVLNDSLFSPTPTYGASLPLIATPDDTACVFFTPTSYRDVRGIAFSHAALSTAFLTQGVSAKITSTSRVMQLSSFNVDVALAEIFTTLVHGGCVCVPSATERLHNFAGAVKRMNVDWTYMTPLLSRKLDPATMPTLKTVCFRTRGLDEDTYSPWAGKVNVILAYGSPDVCTLGISFLEAVGPHRLQSIGRPIAGSFWVVNPEDHRRLMPIGAIGELVIEGPTLGASFPFTEPTPGSIPLEGPNAGKQTRYFKTSHRVRYMDGGMLEFVSTKRDDNESNGKVVNLTDIEQKIRRCLGQGVDVMVEAIAFRDAKSVPVLTAFIELGDKSFKGSDDLRKLPTAIKERTYIAKQLIEMGLRNVVAPDLMPSIFVPVKHLPITSSLKVNRKRLQKLIHGLSKEQLLAISEISQPNNIQSIRLKPLPLTQSEERMRSIWAAVLSVDESKINAGDSFFRVGGDAVLAAKLVVACRHEGITLCIADVLRNASLTELSRNMSVMDESNLPEPYTPASPVLTSPQPGRSSLTETFIQTVIAPKIGVDRSAIKDITEATAMQTRYIESGILRGRANINYFVFSFTGSVNAKKLEEACQMLATIHPIIRTAFVPYNRKVYQAVVKTSSLDFKRYVCSSWRLSTLTEKMIRNDQATPIAFSSPMARFMLLDAGKQSSLIVRLCKAQYDDFSVALLVKDLKRLYDSPSNPQRRPSFCEFVRGAQIANALPGAEQYWKTLLDGATMTQVVAHNRPYLLSSAVKTIRQKLMIGSLANLGISFETVLKSAWAMVLASLSGSSDVVFGELVDGRHVRLPGSQSAAGVLGPTLNAIPVRVQFPDKALSPLELLQYVHGQRIAGIPFENVGFLDVVEKCTPWPYWTRFGSTVQHQDEGTVVNPNEPKAFHLGSAACRFSIIESRAQDVYDLVVHSIMRGAGRVELGLAFCPDRVPPQLAERALRMLCETVNLLTSVSIMQPVIPGGFQYRGMPKAIPILPPTNELTEVLASEQQPFERLSEDATRTIQTSIAAAWAAVLDPRSLGVPEEHVHNAAFYDLWGSLIPAAQLAAYFARELPKLSLPGLDAAVAGSITMEEIIAHPTMLRQFELVARKMSSGRATATAAVTTKERETPITPSRSKRPTITVSVNIGKSIRRLAEKASRMSPTSASAPPAQRSVPLTGSPLLSPHHSAVAPQLPQLRAMSPISSDASTTATAAAVDMGRSHTASSAESMTSGSSADDDDETPRGQDPETVVSPLSAGAIPGVGAVRVWGSPIVGTGGGADEHRLVAGHRRKESLVEVMGLGVVSPNRHAM